MTKITISEEGCNPISITLSDNNKRKTIYRQVIKIAKEICKEFTTKCTTHIKPFTIIQKNNEFYNENDFASGKSQYINAVYFNILAYYKDKGTDKEFKDACNDEKRFITEFKKKILKDDYVKTCLSSIKNDGDNDGGIIQVYIKK